MIVTPRFVYLHLHKSGGTFVNEALLRFVPGARQIGYHLPAQLIPAAARSLPALGFVRNPWDYYVSWFSFQSGLSQPNHLFRCVSEDGSLGFKDTIRRLLDLQSDPALLHRVLQGLPTVYVDRGLNLPQQALEPIRDSGLGFYSYLYRYMYGENLGGLHVGRSEELRSGLIGFFEQIGFVPPPPMLEFIRDADGRNRSQRRHYADYYDDELRQRVAERDASLIQAHGYVFEYPSSGN